MRAGSGRGVSERGAGDGGGTGVALVGGVAATGWTSGTGVGIGGRLGDPDATGGDSGSDRGPIGVTGCG